MAEKEDTNTVKVKSLKYFKGEAGEGTDGSVVPNDTLTVSRQRAADLYANGLVDSPDGKKVVAPEKAAEEPADKRADTAASVSVNDKRKPVHR